MQMESKLPKLQDDVQDLPPGYRITELDPLPEEWRVVKLGDVYEVQQGKGSFSQKDKLFGLYQGRGNKTTIPNLSKHGLAEFPIPLPPLEEQREISGSLQTVDRKIEAEEAHKEALDDLFKTLLHHLMTAKIRLPTEFIAQFKERKP